MTEPIYAILYDKLAGKRDDGYAVALVAHERALSQQGYVVDRLSPMKVEKVGKRCWKYDIPLRFVSA